MLDESTPERFTDSTKTIVQQLPWRAHDRGFNARDRGSIAALSLWTIIRWELKVGLAAFMATGVDLERLARELDSLLAKKSDRCPVAIKDGFLVDANTGKPPTRMETALAPLLEEARRQARELRHEYVGSEHLLLAVIREADSELSALLDEHSISYERVKETILGLLER